MHILDHLVQKFERLSESAATPRMSGKLGLASAGSLAKSLTPSSSSGSSTMLGGQMPKLGSAGSSFATEAIQQVVEGRPVSCPECGNCCGFKRTGDKWVCQDCKRISESVMDPHDIEMQASNVSRAGQSTGRDVLLPGASIGIRGPRHNGHHAVVSVNGPNVTLKNDQGNEETVPISSLDDHEVVHSLETV